MDASIKQGLTDLHNQSNCKINNCAIDQTVIFFPYFMNHALNLATLMQQQQHRQQRHNTPKQRQQQHNKEEKNSEVFDWQLEETQRNRREKKRKKKRKRRRRRTRKGSRKTTARTETTRTRTARTRRRTEQQGEEEEERRWSMSKELFSFGTVSSFLSPQIQQSLNIKMVSINAMTANLNHTMQSIRANG